MEALATTLSKPAPANPYAQAFEEVHDRSGPDWLASLRRSALARFLELGLPTTRHEDWRYTNLAPLAKFPFEPAASNGSWGVTAATMEGFHFASLKGPRLVFVNGYYAPELSAPFQGKDGVRVRSLNAQLNDDPDSLKRYLTAEAQGQGALAALNTAFFEDGAFIHVPSGKTVENPIQLFFISAGDAELSISPRNVIIADKGASVTVIENYVSVASDAYLTNAATSIYAGENATVEHLKFQDENLSAFHIAGLQLRLERAANVIAHSIALGARLSRNNIHTHLGGEGIECILNGLYLTKDDQLADHWMLVEHAQPHCNSHEYFNGILDDRSRGVFHGRILVQPVAQKTDAKQTNKNLLLSEDAIANTKPQLEIYADDVKCTHGATIGQLNEESIFYLRSRGIGPETARRILIHAFAGEIIERIRHAGIREELDGIIWDRLEANPHITSKA